MKKFTGLVVILAALVLGSYYGMGYLTERKVREGLSIVNQSNGFAADIVQYQRGWFTSKASLDWHLHIPEHVVQTVDGKSQTVAAEDYQMQMPVTIYHGPLMFTGHGVKFGLGFARTELALPAKYVTQFNNLFSSQSVQPKLDISFFVNYLATTSIDTSVPAFKLFAKNGDAQFDWLGMSTATSVSARMDKVDGNITIDGIHFTKGPITSTMSAINSEYNLHKTDSGLFLGEASLSFPSLVVLNKSTKLFALGQFDLRSNSDIKDGLFSSQFKTSLEKVFANGKDYGPGNLQVAIRNLDAEVLAKLNAQLNQLQQGPDAERQKAMLAMLPELPRLFNKGAEFEITEMNFMMPEGAIEGKLMVSLPKGEFGNPFELIQKIQGQGKLKVPTVIVQQLMTESIKQKMMSPQTTAGQQGIVDKVQPQVSIDSSTQAATNSSDVAQQASLLADKQLATMVQSGMLSVQGNNYVIEVSLSQGQLTVNGKPFNPAMMKF